MKKFLVAIDQGTTSTRVILFDTKGNKKFIKLANDFINIDEIDLDLINTINPFQNAFREFLIN